MKTRTQIESHYRVLQSQVVTEKATSLAEDVLGSGRAFVFNVTQDATKLQVRAAIEHVFAVKVAKVRVLNCKGKVRNYRHRRGGNRAGRCAMQRRAYVRLLPGHDIDFFKLSGGVA